MSVKVEIQPSSELELALCRILDVSPENAFRAWTDPKLMKEWFCPKPWTITDVNVDLRAGGGSSMTIRGPNGEAMPNNGVYLEVVPNRKIVFMDAFTAGWIPSVAAPFMVAIVEFEPHPGGKTKYTARARHWNKETLEQHKQMGFETGWGICADQLEALMKNL